MRSLRLIMEGSRDNMLLSFLGKVKEVHPDCTLSELKKFLLNKFVNEAHIRSLSMPSNFYLAGVARYYFNGDLTTNKVLNIFDESVTDSFIEDVCNKLTALIRVLRNKYLDSEGVSWEQPEDFGTISLEKLFRKYNKAIEKEIGLGREYETDVKAVPEVIAPKTVLKNYTYEIIYNQVDARKYENATSPGSWCITYAPYHYDYYTRRNNSFFVIFKQNNWEDVPRPKTVPEHFPLDEYGISLMAIQLSKDNGQVVGGTTRWNHGHGDIDVTGDADKKVDFAILNKITGITENGLQDILETWKHNYPLLKIDSTDDDEDEKISREDIKEAIRQLNYIQICINDGQSPFNKTRAFPNGMLANPRILDKSINNIFKNEKYFNATPEEVWKKCCIAGDIIVNNINFTAIIDRGKVVRNSVTPFQIGVTDYFNVAYNKNLVAFEKTGSKFSCYDKLNRKLLEINGKTAFCDIDECFFGGIAVVKTMPRQYHIYDSTTGRFLEYNGYDTFEYITYGCSDCIAGTKSEQHYKERIMYVIVDSSSREYFIFDTEKKTILPKQDGLHYEGIYQLNNLDKKNIIAFVVSDNWAFHKSGQHVYPSSNSHGWYSPSTREKLYDVDKQDFITYNGIDTFSDFNVINKKFISLKPYNFTDDSFFKPVYDTFEAKYLSINGEELLRHYPSYHRGILFINKNNDYKFLPLDEENDIEFEGNLGKINLVSFDFVGIKGYYQIRDTDYKYYILSKDGVFKDNSGNPIAFDDYDYSTLDYNGKSFHNDTYRLNFYYGYDVPEEKIEFIRIADDKLIKSEIMENFYRLVNYII